MYNRIFKNYQVNLGMPFQVKPPVSFDTIKKFDEPEDEKDESAFDAREITEEMKKKAMEEADLVIKEAEYEAQRIIENTEIEIEERRLAVEEEAKQKGYEDGFNEAKKQYEDLIQEAEFVREHAKAEYKEVLESIESDTVNVIIDIAKKVIGSELSLNKENILFLVKQAFEKCTNKENIVLKVGAEDYDFLSESRDRLLSMVEGIGGLEIKKDSSLKAGVFIVETQYGSIDAGVQTKLKKIEQAFRQVIGQ